MTLEELALHCNNCPNLDKCALALSDYMYGDELQNIDCEYYIPVFSAIKEYCENKIYEAFVQCIKEN